MIFVVLGTQKFQLNRLLKKLDIYVENGLLQGKEIIAQIGNSDYEPLNYQYDRFMDKEKFDNFVQKADLIITHSGVGTIITGLTSKKPVIVFPRMAKYHEHVDDHQLDIARAFEKKNYVLCCYNEDELLIKVQECRKHDFNKYTSQRENIVGIVDGFLRNQS